MSSLADRRGEFYKNCLIVMWKSRRNVTKDTEWWLFQRLSFHIAWDSLREVNSALVDLRLYSWYIYFFYEMESFIMHEENDTDIYIFCMMVIPVAKIRTNVLGWNSTEISQLLSTKGGNKIEIINKDEISLSYYQ